MDRLAGLSAESSVAEISEGGTIEALDKSVSLRLVGLGAAVLDLGGCQVLH